MQRLSDCSIKPIELTHEKKPHYLLIAHLLKVLLVIYLMETFTKYSTPLDQSAFSQSFYSCLTFDALSDPLVSFPAIASPGAVEQWCFDREVPQTAEGTVVLPNEIIPHLDDLRPILLAFQSAYAEGFRSVAMRLHLSDTQTIYRTYHFRKV